MQFYAMTDANWRYTERNWSLLKEKYPGKTIIVLNECVICASDDQQKLLKAIEVLSSEERAQIYYIYVPKKNELFSGINACDLAPSQINTGNG